MLQNKARYLQSQTFKCKSVKKISVPGYHSLDFQKAQPLSEMCTIKCLFNKSLSAAALLFITELQVSLWLLFTIRDMQEAAHVTSDLSSALSKYSTHCPLFAPFPRLNQSLQGDWALF